MNLTSTEAERYFRTLVPLVSDVVDVDLFVLPPFTSIWVARAVCRDSNVAWGAQDVHPDEAGPHTGDIAAVMLADLGCSYVEVGHSERRRDHGETDELIGAKVQAVLRHGMVPLLCVGERSRGSLNRALDIVVHQLNAAFAGVPPEDRARVVIAYEPVWAIGEGASAAEPEVVAAMFAGIHGWLSSIAGVTRPRVIYGGSVDPATAGQLLATAGVDGLFVGRAALDPAHFSVIAHAAVPSPPLEPALYPPRGNQTRGRR